MADRIAEISRKTEETDIRIKINLDGKGDASSVDTGIGFFDHMLKSFAKHGLFDLEVAVKGDLYVDSHHSIEDTGIVLGKAIKKAVGDKAGIKRYGSFTMPMDEALILSAVDLSGRPYYSSDIELTVPRVGYFDTEMFQEFFYAVSYGAEMNIHFKQFSGVNNHHIIEAAFKAFANALKMAVSKEERLGNGLLSTKGAL